jgi:hypothetical protein
VKLALAYTVPREIALPASFTLTGEMLVSNARCIPTLNNRILSLVSEDFDTAGRTLPGT